MMLIICKRFRGKFDFTGTNVLTFTKQTLFTNKMIIIAPFSQLRLIGCETMNNIFT